MTILSQRGYFENNCKGSGSALADVRVPAGLTQEEVVRRSDVSRKCAGAVESGIRLGAEFGKLLAVLRALEVGCRPHSLRGPLGK